MLRYGIIVARVTARAGSAGATAATGALAFPWSVGIGFTNPTRVLAE
jgi:hypothetical protein